MQWCFYILCRVTQTHATKKKVVQIGVLQTSPKKEVLQTSPKQKWNSTNNIKKCITFPRNNMFFEIFQSSSFNRRSRNVGLNQLTLYENTSAVCSTWCLSKAVLDAWNVVTLHGHLHPAATSWLLYSMPDEHLGAVDHARHDSVGVHIVSDIWLAHRRLGGIRTSHNFDSRFGWVGKLSMGNLSCSKTTSVPTNEVRNNFDRNPGLRSPRGSPPPL